jgi:hypothetical protein
MPFPETGDKNRFGVRNLKKNSHNLQHVSQMWSEDCHNLGAVSQHSQAESNHPASFKRSTFFESFLRRTSPGIGIHHNSSWVMDGYGGWVCIDSLGKRKLLALSGSTIPAHPSNNLLEME